MDAAVVLLRAFAAVLCLNLGHSQEALTLYPLLDVTALPTDEQTDEPTLEELDLEAYYQVSENYEPDPAPAIDSGEFGTARELGTDIVKVISGDTEQSTS